MNFDSYLVQYFFKKLEVGNRPKYKSKTTKLPEDNIKENHWDLGLGKYF